MRLLLLLAVVLALFAIATPVAASVEKTADEIKSELDGLERPAYDREKRGDAEYMAGYREKVTEFQQRRADLIRLLWRADAAYDGIDQLLAERWSTFSRDEAKRDTALAEIDEILSGKSDEALVKTALYSRVQVFQTGAYAGDEQCKKSLRPAADAFVNAHPKDDRVPRLLQTIAQRFTDDPKEAKAIFRKLIADFPDNRSAKYWPGKIRQFEELNKPFALEFEDAISGDKVSMAALRGKVVVVDFWATWCGPCVAEMPHMKELYAQYKDKGVEFIGISLDQPVEKGGLEKLKKYCGDNAIEWPQYYQGNFWSSDYSVSWGINSIPAMFILDKAGNLHSTQARGKLDQMIPKLLAENFGN